MPETTLDQNPSSIQTRVSLLSRLRDLDDHVSWRTFFERYWRLLYYVARHSGYRTKAVERNYRCEARRPWRSALIIGFWPLAAVMTSRFSKLAVGV